MDKDKLGSRVVYTCFSNGNIMAKSPTNKLDIMTNIVKFASAIDKDEISIMMMFNDIAIITDINSDHILMFKQIIEAWEGSFK